MAELKDTIISGNLSVTGGANIQDNSQLTGNLTLYATSGDSPSIIFQRGSLGDTLNDYKIVDTSGYLTIYQQGNSGTSGFTQVARLTNTGELTISTPPASNTTPSTTAGFSPTDSNIKIATDATIASGDKIVIRDTSDSNKMRSSSITFGSSTTQFLANNGTWQTPAGGVTDVQIDGASIVSSGVANIVTSTAHPYSSTNALATMGDIAAAGGGTVTSVGVSNATDGGLSVSGSPITSSGTISIGHSNVLTNAQTTQAVYPIKIDKNGHISGYGDAVTIPTASTTNPSMDGTASYGSGTSYARSNHVHPTDTSRQAVLVSGTNIKTINNNSILGSGDLSITEGLAPLIGYTTNITPSQVLNAVLEGRDVDISYNDNDFGLLHFTSFNVASSFGVVIGNTILYYYGTLLAFQLIGASGAGTWELRGDTLVQISDLSNYVPTSRTINGADLSSDITLSASDVGAQPTLVSGTNIKTINNESILGSGNITISSGATTTWYGTSSTTASTAAKIVTCSGFSLVTGAIIGVLFSTANTAATPTLNVNSTGEKTIYVGSSTLNATTNVLKWSANTMLYFMYDGTYYRYITSVAAASVQQPRGANTWYGTSSTAAGTAAKTSTIENYVLTPGAVVAITFTQSNTVSDVITLDVNSTGAKQIWVGNSATSTTNPLLWDVNDTVTFIYTGSAYMYIGKNKKDTIVTFTPNETTHNLTISVQQVSSIVNGNTISY